jgi:hypothetical protein
VTEHQLPAHLRDLPSRGLAARALANIGAGSPPIVSIMGNRFTLVDAVGSEEQVTTHDPKLGVYLDCCVVDVGDHESKIYFGAAFDPNATSWPPPKCWSDNGVAPSRLAGEPQARTCTPDPTGQHGCRWAVWGSATSKVSGKGVPACGKYQKLALVPLGRESAFLLRVPPNSLSNLQAYFARFKGEVGPEHVVTRVSFDPGTLGTLVFGAISYIDPPTADAVRKLVADKATDAMVGRGDQPIAMAAVALPPQEATRPLPASAAADPASLPHQGSASATTAQTATTTSPSDQPTRRRRRTAASDAQAPNGGQGTQAPFRPSQPPGSAAAGGFGMVEGQAPGEELDRELDTLFGPAPGR